MKFNPLFRRWGKTVLGYIKRRRNRRSISRLLAYEEYHLEDIGVSRADLLAALSSRLEKDPSRSLARIALDRGKAKEHP